MCKEIGYFIGIPECHLELAKAYNASTMPNTVVKHTVVPEHISETLARKAIEAIWDEEGNPSLHKSILSEDLISKKD